MDIACGKGGDIPKWQIARIRNLYGFDLSLVSLNKAKKRKLETRFCSFYARFIEENACVDPKNFFERVEEEVYFDIVSCQFALHYMLKSEQTARNFFENISRKLVKGGYFISTHPDANVIVQKLRKQGKQDEKGRTFVKNDYYSIISPTTEFSNKSIFGHLYGFFLDNDLVGKKDESDKVCVLEYVSEYLIIVDELAKIAADYDLKIVKSQNFHDFYAKNIKKPEHFTLFKK